MASTNTKPDIELREKMRDSLKNYYQDKLGLSDWEERAEKRTKLLVAENHVKRLERHITLKNRKILDVGSGLGDFVLSANIHGAISFGIEPEKEWIKLSKSWFETSKMNPLLCIGVGENLPFKDDTFDIVSCNFVLEHTKNPIKVIKEMIRVLRPGGFCYINVPNYLYPLEQHYGVLWVPFLPKKLARLYLALRGRNPSYIDHINYITAYSVLKYLHELDLNIKVNLVEEAICEPELINSKKWQYIARIIKNLRIPLSVITLIAPVLSVIISKVNRRD